MPLPVAVYEAGTLSTSPPGQDKGTAKVRDVLRVGLGDTHYQSTEEHQKAQQNLKLSVKNG